MQNLAIEVSNGGCLHGLNWSALASQSFAVICRHFQENRDFADEVVVVDVQPVRRSPIGDEPCSSNCMR